MTHELLNATGFIQSSKDVFFFVTLFRSDVYSKPSLSSLFCCYYAFDCLCVGFNEAVSHDFQKPFLFVNSD